MGESGGRLSQLKEFCFKRSILIFITLASFGGAAFLVGLGLNAQTVFPGSDPNALESPSDDSRPLSTSASLVGTCAQGTFTRGDRHRLKGNARDLARIVLSRWETWRVRRDSVGGNPKIVVNSEKFLIIWVR